MQNIQYEVEKLKNYLSTFSNENILRFEIIKHNWNFNKLCLLLLMKSSHGKKKASKMV